MSSDQMDAWEISRAMITAQVAKDREALSSLVYGELTDAGKIAEVAGCLTSWCGNLVAMLAEEWDAESTELAWETILAAGRERGLPGC